MKRKARLRTTRPLRRKTRLCVKGRRRFPDREDRTYLAWVRRQSCTLWGRSRFVGTREVPHRCHGRIVAHHTKTKGAGGHDHDAIPLCQDAHEDGHTLGWTTYGKRYGVDWHAEAARCRARYLAETGPLV